jgi:carbon-monoxide dehydrogenase medium subunit
MTLIPTLKQRLAKPSQLIDLGGIAALKGISEEGDAVVIGAMTRHADVNRSDVVKRAIPALAALAGGIGDPAVRNRGTIGGSIANNDPAADYPAAVVALNATVPTSSSPACSRPHCSRARSSPRCASRRWRRPITRNSAIPPRATRSSAFSWRGRRPGSGSR